MKKKITRRDFVLSSAAAGVAAAAPATVFGSSPTLIIQNDVKPLVIASGNGNTVTNGGTKTCVEVAFDLMTGGTDVLESLIAGVNVVELDPKDSGVGYGGRPNADGVVQLDSCCMHGPLKRAGGVAALEGVRTPSKVAYAVMQNTDHHLLVGDGAQQFARNMGFEIEADLNTENSRRMWLEWKRRVDPEHYLDPGKRAEAGLAVARQMLKEGLVDEESFWGTINCDGINAKGDVCGVTTTSGLAWKIPGRAGDSPILGAGLYVDNEVGAAGSTGRGEANLFNLCSFFIVEEMRRGSHPKDAGMAALRRVKEATIEKRLLNEQGLPNFGLSFYILNKKGEYAGVSMYSSERSTFALCTDNGAESIRPEPFLEGQATD